MKIDKLTVQTSKGKLQYNLCGNGSPTIVLLNGGSGPIEGWMKILQEVSLLSTVFSYNRFGVPGSDLPKENQDGLTIVNDLREVLKIVGCKAPYLLVGHSLGGLYANLFARLYPQEVAGIVFLESSHPNDLSLNEYQGKTVKLINKIFALFDSFSSQKQFSEVHFVKKTVEQILEIDSFPEIPLYVIAGGKENKMIPEDIRKKRVENQLELLTLSNNSKHIIATKSGHFPQLSEPNLVIDTIQDCLNQIHKTTNDIQ